MDKSLLDAFVWFDATALQREGLPDAEKYGQVARWASAARGRNPLAFDGVNAWLLDNAQWTADKLEANEQVLMRGLIGRFGEQNATLRAMLQALKPQDMVNQAVYAALDQFDRALAGDMADQALREPVAAMFSDFSAMAGRGLREQIAGSKTGPTGTDTATLWGYVNCLSSFDSAVQWALFMPGLVSRQQKGFQMDSLEYRELPAMRFIGKEGIGPDDEQAMDALFRKLDSLGAPGALPGGDALLRHHGGLGVDTAPCRLAWGRFMQSGCPVPEGCLHLDFVAGNNGVPGEPYISRFAEARFSGDMAAMHSREGFDVDAMYDITRNTMLGQGMLIPYPEKYWTAELFPSGWRQPSTVYLFSADWA